MILPGLYRHHKGGTYRVLHTAIHTETGEILVVYHQVDSDTIWVRPYEMFIEYLNIDGVTTSRFSRLSERDQ